MPLRMRIFSRNTKHNLISVRFIISLNYYCIYDVHIHTHFVIVFQMHGGWAPKTKAHNTITSCHSTFYQLFILWLHLNAIYLSRMMTEWMLNLLIELNSTFVRMEIYERFMFAQRFSEYSAFSGAHKSRTIDWNASCHIVLHLIEMTCVLHAWISQLLSLCSLIGRNLNSPELAICSIIMENKLPERLNA